MLENQVAGRRAPVAPYPIESRTIRLSTLLDGTLNVSIEDVVFDDDAMELLCRDVLPRASVHSRESALELIAPFIPSPRDSLTLPLEV